MESSKDSNSQRNVLQSLFKSQNNQNGNNSQQVQMQTANNSQETRPTPAYSKISSTPTEETKIKKNPMTSYRSPQSSINNTNTVENQKMKTSNEETKVAAPKVTQNEPSLKTQENISSLPSSNQPSKTEENKSLFDLKHTDTKDLIKERKISENDIKLIKETSFPVKKNANPAITLVKPPQVKPSSNQETLAKNKSEEKSERLESSQNALSDEMRRIFLSGNQAPQDNTQATKDTKKQTNSSLKTKEEVIISSDITKKNANKLYSSEVIQLKKENQEIKQSNVFQAQPQNNVVANHKPIQIVPPQGSLNKESERPVPAPVEPIYFNPDPFQRIQLPQNNIPNQRNIAGNSSAPSKSNLSLQDLLQNLNSSQRPSQANQQPANQSTHHNSHPSSAPSQLSTNQSNINCLNQSSSQQSTNKASLPSSCPSQEPKIQNKSPNSSSLLASSHIPTNHINSSSQYPSPALKQPTNQSNMPSQISQPAPKQSANQSNLSSQYPPPVAKQPTNQSNLSNPFASQTPKQPLNQSNLPSPSPSQEPKQPINQSNLSSLYLPKPPMQQPQSQNNLSNLFLSQGPIQKPQSQNNLSNLFLSQGPIQKPQSQNNLLYPYTSQAPKQQPLSQNNINEKPYNIFPPPEPKPQLINHYNIKNDIQGPGKPDNPNKYNSSYYPSGVNQIVYNPISSPPKPDPFNRNSAPYQLPNSQQTQDKKADMPDLYERPYNLDNPYRERSKSPLRIPPAPTPFYDTQTSSYEDSRYIPSPLIPINHQYRGPVNYDELFDFVLNFEFAKADPDAFEPQEIPSYFENTYDYEKWIKPAFFEELKEFQLRAYNEIYKARNIRTKLEIKAEYGRIRNSDYEDSFQNHEVIIIVPESQRYANLSQYLKEKNFYKIGIINKLPPPKGCQIIWKNGLALGPYQDQYFRITSLDKLVSSSREFRTFQFLPSCQLLEYVLCPTHTVPEELSVDLLAYLESIQHEFNESQFDAIREILQVSKGISLLQGPPGTGKTKTIVGILSGFLTKIKMRKFPNILLCAPSNIAIDEIGLRIVRNGLFIQSQDPEGILIIRIGKRNLWEEKDNDYEEPDEIKSMRLEFLVEQKLKELGKRDTKKEIESVNKEINDFKGLISGDEESDQISWHIEQLRAQLVTLKNQLKDYQRAKKSIRDDLLKRANVILTTLSGAGSEMLKSKNIDYVIIDEACQSAELTSLIPFQYNPQHVVLVGDPNQLPATMISEKSEKNKYCRSLFERLAQIGAEYKFLSTQYRMTQEICQFPSNFFYEGKLACAPNFFENRPIPEWINPSGVMFFDLMDSGEEKEETETSYYNKNEAAFIEEIYRCIKLKNPNKNIEIGVITPYSKQVEIIKTQLTRFHRKEWEKHIEVRTIDGFQGREKDAIILSLVRTEGIGFLWNKKRINVSLTRSKFGLWVVGRSACLEVDETWGAFIRHCREQEKLKTCFNFDEVSYYFSKEKASPIGRDSSYSHVEEDFW